VRAGLDVRVLRDPAAAAAELLARHARAGSHIVLTGGSTPAGAYSRAAQMDVDWSDVTLWFGDERCVAPDDALSNHAMVKASLLDLLEGPPPRVERMLGERGPDAGSEEYEARLRGTFGAGMPELDLVLLGLGSDGHCASLFPGRPELEVTDRVAVGVPEAGMEPFVPRITLTLPVIDAGREVVFLVTGEGKAQAAERAFAQDPSRDVPASLVNPASGSLTVLIDPAAASRLAE
jgi:6-phosphogluconolactonase